MASKIIEDKSADPPAETKGKGTPVIGKIPKFIPICITVSVKITQKTPTKNDPPSLLLVLLTKVVNLQSTAKIEAKIIVAPKKPSSSDIAAKIKSVCFSGKKASWVWIPFPNPLPKNLPEPTEIIAWILLYPAPLGSLPGFKNALTLCL